MNEPKQRQPHADFIIMQAEDMSLRFEEQQSDASWLFVEYPCYFYEGKKYRLHEREFPKTSLSDDELNHIGNVAVMSNHGDAYIHRQVANAAIRQYILDTEESK